MNSQFVEKAEMLWKETEAWKRTWKHRKPCKEWKQNEMVHSDGFCKHYANARYRKFKERITALFELPTDI